MPTYQYQCADCRDSFEQFQKFSEDPLTECPACSGSVHRVIQNVGIVFKGSGWYITDSRKSSKSDTASAGSPTVDSTKTDTPEAKSAATGDTGKSTDKSTAAPEKAKPAPAPAS